MSRWETRGQPSWGCEQGANAGGSICWKRPAIAQNSEASSGWKNVGVWVLGWGKKILMFTDSIWNVAFPSTVNESKQPEEHHQRSWHPQKQQLISYYITLAVGPSKEGWYVLFLQCYSSSEIHHKILLFNVLRNKCICYSDPDTFLRFILLYFNKSFLLCTLHILL